MSIPPVNCHPSEPVFPNVLYRPSYLAFDSQGNLWVSDNGNNRVLEFAPPFHDGQNASLVLGQPDLKSEVNWPLARGPVIPPYGISYQDGDHASVHEIGLTTKQGSEGFTSEPVSENLKTVANEYVALPNAFNSPNGMAFDVQGNLWIVDSGNNRILEFRPPFTNYMNSSLVIGQDNFGDSGAKGDQNGFFNPVAVAFDSGGNLWVVDCYMTRVLEFEPPFHNGMNASLVIGQKDFTGYSPSTSPTGMFQPYSLAFDSSNNLWVVDGANSRVLEYNPPFSNGIAASIVVGQKDFSLNVRGLGPDILTLPTSLSFDNKGNLWIFDENSRVLGFRPPFHTGMNASLVIGQKDLTSKDFSLSQNGLDRGPDYITFDKNGDLWVSEGDNNRVLEFSSQVSSVPEFSLIIPILLIGMTSSIMFYRMKIMK